MNKVLMSLMVAATLMFAGQAAMAAPQTFDSSMGKFSVDVPADWTAKAIADGCQLTSKDEKNSMAIQIVNAGDLTNADFAERIAKAIDMNVTEKRDNGNMVVWDGTANGDKVLLMLRVKDKKALSIIMGGEMRGTMGKIFDSMKME